MRTKKAVFVASSNSTTKRFFSGSPLIPPSNSSSSKEDSAERQDESEPILLYRAPMGNLVSRLKRISITSCLVSVIGLPLLIYLKNGTWPDAKQLGMGGFAFLSATGSTLALHFVFGPYVLELYEIPTRTSSSSIKHKDSAEAEDEQQQQQQRADQEYLYQATTRSILGLKRQVVFDPLTDVTKYAGARPFANFIVKGQYVLYCHPELLDETTRLKLLNPKGSSSPSPPSSSSSSDSQVRRPVDEQDGFL